MAEITKADLKADLPDHKVERIKADSPEDFDKAVRKAKIWVRSKYRQCSSDTIDWSDSLVEEAALERAKYEIYALQESEDVAEDKKENAADLIVAVLGGCAEGDGDAPAAAVVDDDRPSWLDHFEGRTNPEDDGRRRVP